MGVESGTRQLPCGAAAGTFAFLLRQAAPLPSVVERGPYAYLPAPVHRGGSSSQLPRSQPHERRLTSTTRKCSSSSPNCSSTRRGTPRRSRPIARRRRRTTAACRVRARIGFVRTALRIGQFQEAQREAASLKTWRRGTPRRCRPTPTRIWSAGLFDEAEGSWRDALALAPESSRARHGLARALASQSKLDDALERSAGRAQALAARRRAASHRRLDLRAACTATNRRPRPTRTTSTCCRTRIAATRRRGRGRRCASCKSFGEREPISIDDVSADAPAHRGLPPRGRQGDRPGQGQRRPAAGLRPRHRAPSRRPSRARRPRTPTFARSPTRSAPASAKWACADCSSGGSTRSRSARSGSTTCRC